MAGILYSKTECYLQCIYLLYTYKYVVFCIIIVFTFYVLCDIISFNKEIGSDSNVFNGHILITMKPILTPLITDLFYMHLQCITE